MAQILQKIAKELFQKIVAALLSAFHLRNLRSSASCFSIAERPNSTLRSG